MIQHELMTQARAAAAQSDFELVLVLFGKVDVGTLPQRDIFEWILVLAECLHAEESKELLRYLTEDSFLQKANRLLSSWEAIEGNSGAETDGANDAFDVDIDLRQGNASADQDLVDAFLRFFGGRRDVYAKAWYDEKRRRSGYQPVEQPLTEAVVRAHLDGKMTIGQYLLHPDGACSFGVIDLDLSANAREELRSSHGPDASPMLYTELRNYLIRLLQAGTRIGLPLFGEDSGGKGAHVWIFFEPRRAAKAVRTVLGQIVAAAGPVPANVSVELFPKQDKLGPKGLSSLVKLPFGRHPATLRACHILDDLGNPIEDAKVAIQRLRPAPMDLIDALAGRRLVVLEAPELVRVDTVPKLTEVKSARSLAEVLRAIEVGEAQRAAIEKMMAGCKVLSGLVAKAYETHRLSADESRALIYTIGLVGSSNSFLDEVLAAARVSTLEMARVRKGLPSPTGCNKLRMLLPGVECKCFAGEKPLPYASPTLYAVGQIEASQPRWKPFAGYLEADASVLANPLETIAASLERIESRIDKLEGK